MMTLAQLTYSKSLSASHQLIVFSKGKILPKDLPHGDLLASVLKRRDIKAEELAKTPISANAADGTLVAWAMLDADQNAFSQQVLVRKALQSLLDEQPRMLGIAVSGANAQRAAELAVYGAWVNGTLLPTHKSKNKRKPLQKIELAGGVDRKPFDALRAQAEGNLLCRSLTALPPNELTPGLYRKRVKDLAKQQGWQLKEFDLKALRKMGAGAFVAVAQGSHDEDAAIVHLTYKYPKAKRTVALVGKGICFDTG
jgi:leucyl aminopeptidase